MYYYYDYHSPVGKLTIASGEKNIVGLWLDGQKYSMDILEGKEYQENETEASQKTGTFYPINREECACTYYHENARFQEI